MARDQGLEGQREGTRPSQRVMRGPELGGGTQARLEQAAKGMRAGRG